MPNPIHGAGASRLPMGPKYLLFIQLHPELVRQRDLDTIAGDYPHLALKGHGTARVGFHTLPQRDSPVEARPKELRVGAPHPVLQYRKVSGRDESQETGADQPYDQEAEREPSDARKAHARDLLRRFRLWERWA